MSARSFPNIGKIEGRFSKHWKILLLAGLGLARAVAADPGPGRPGDLATLEGLVAEWVDLRSAGAAESARWDQERAALAAETNLLAREQAQLESTLAAARTRAIAANQELAERETALARDRADLAALEPLLRHAADCLNTWKPQLPPPLARELTPDFLALAAMPTNAAPDVLARQAQAICAIYSRMDAWQSTVQASRELVRAGAGPDQELDVIYLGLDRAYAVAPRAADAWLGVPTARGWEWAALPGLGAAVRRAVSLHGQPGAGQLVPLPLPPPRSWP